MEGFYRLAPFDETNAAPTGDLAALHEKLLPQSPLTLLGRHFMERYYYQYLARDGLIFGAVAYVGEAPTGFISATADSNGFMRAALSRHLLTWAWAGGVTLLRSPRRLRALWEIVRIMRFRTRLACEGEILSLGVLPEYRGARFANDAGLHIANDLLEHVMEKYRERKISAVRAIADVDNAVAHRFYANHGGIIINERVKGWRVPSVEFILRLPGYQEQY